MASRPLHEVVAEANQYEIDTARPELAAAADLRRALEGK